MEHQDYVLGFLVSTNFAQVALIGKLKPEFQKGRLNGIGGKIEPGEKPIDAMSREFWEETGVTIEPDKWDLMGQYKFHGGRCYVYRACGDYTLQQREKEIPAWYPLRTIDDWPLMENVNWMTRMAAARLGFIDFTVKTPGTP